MDSNRIKAVIDLHDYLDTIGEDRPPLGVFLKGLEIDPKVMSDCVTNVAHSAHICEPSYAVEITNYLFKLGVTIGYKYAIKKQMEKEFGMESEDERTNETE